MFFKIQHYFRKVKFGHLFLSIFEKMKILLGKKKVKKIREKPETIKKIKVRPLQKVFKFCDDNFFLKNIN